MQLDCSDLFIPAGPIHAVSKGPIQSNDECQATHQLPFLRTLGVRSQRSSYFIPNSTYSLIASSTCAPANHYVSSRVIAGFLLGWVFWSGLAYAGRSHFFQQLARLCWNRVCQLGSAKAEAHDLEAQETPINEKKSQRPPGESAQLRRVSNEAALAFTLDICLALAGFAEFGSLLVFGPNGGATCGMFCRPSRNSR